MYAFDGGVRACEFVLLVFFAITLAHCRPFEKLGKLGAVLYFFAGTFITQTFASLVTKLVKIYIVVSDTAFTFTLSENEDIRAMLHPSPFAMALNMLTSGRGSPG